MVDLNQAFRGLIEDPSVAPEPVEAIRRRGTARRRRRRLTLFAAAVVVAAGVSTGAVLAFRAPGRTQAAITTTSPDALARLTAGWHHLGTIPRGVVSSDSAVWTGKELIIWNAVSGVSFDPATGHWHQLPTSPLARRALVTMAWTGREILVWGGTAGFTATSGATPFTDGAAYNPATDSWRRLPDARIKPRLALGSVWTGTEFIVAGGPANTVGQAASSADAVTDAAAYNPTSNRWRRIPGAPIRVTTGVVRWTGSEMLVYGSLRTDFLDPKNGTISDAQAALYDPTINRWRELSPPNLNGVLPIATVTRHQLVAVAGYVSIPRSYNLYGSTWHDTTGLHATPNETCSETLSGSPTEALLSNCGEFWAYDPTINRWAPAPSPDVPFEQQPWGEPIWTGHAFLYWATNPWSPGPVPVSDAKRKDLEIWAYAP